MHTPFTRLPAQRTWLLFTVLVLLSAAARAADVIVDPYYEYRDEVGRGEFGYDDSADIPWIENETEVLAVPKAADLSPVILDRAPEGIEVLVDKTRIDVNPDDRVVRVWLWVRSESGAERGTYEGFRCDTREYKVYAYANPNREPPVSKAKRPRWIAVKGNSRSDYRRELLRDYFCDLRGTRTAGDIRDLLTGQFRRKDFLSN